jgi:hypothetical protein
VKTCGDTPTDPAGTTTETAFSSQSVMTLALADMGTPMASQVPIVMAEAEWLIDICPSLSLLQIEPKSRKPRLLRGRGERVMPLTRQMKWRRLIE